ncbi:hypothetical protein HDU87_004166 [Geranomyces variabilis]|uniref:WLM domain-containing protein n=1 Tax=Geranomyces variabilis TaxID=109894 RepID=A0AAD5XM60_9FUNG|nr:hypothetical protein HDU87_004166 [Geranomyces variabilis]
MTGFLAVKPLEGIYTAESASESYAAYLLRRLASEPGVLAVMHERNWTVAILGEYDNTRDKEDLMDGNYIPCWGFHKTVKSETTSVNSEATRHDKPSKSEIINAGERHEIYVCLRNPTTEKQGNAHMSFVGYEDIKVTLFHELAHFVHSVHHDEFYNLCKELTDEAMAFELSFTDFKESVRNCIKSIIANNKGATAVKCLLHLSSIMQGYLVGLKQRPASVSKDLSRDIRGLASTRTPEWSRVSASDPSVAASILDINGARELLLAIGFESHYEALTEIFVNDKFDRLVVVGPWIQFTLDDMRDSITINDADQCDGEQQAKELFRLLTTRERQAARRENFLSRRPAGSKVKMSSQQLDADVRNLRRRQYTTVGHVEAPTQPPQLLQQAKSALSTFRIYTWKDLIVVMLPFVVYWATAAQRAQQQQQQQHEYLIDPFRGRVRIDSHSDGPETWKIVAGCAGIYFLLVRRTSEKEPHTLIKDDGSIRVQKLKMQDLGVSTGS